MEKIAGYFRRTPGTRPNPLQGCYTALAIFLPWIILILLGHGAFGSLVMVGALLTAFGDPGMSSPRQARALLVTAVGGAFMTALGRLIGGPWWVEVGEIFLAVFLCGLLAAYGQVVETIGTLLTVILVLSLSTHGSLATAGPAAAGFLLGGVILVLFALLVRRLRTDHRAPGNEAQVSWSRLDFAALTTHFTWTSPLLRFSVLRAMGAAVTAALGWPLGGSYPYWAVLIVIICARPDQKTSLAMALQNIIATVLGALVAEIVMASVQKSLVGGLIIVAVTFLAFTVKELNYTLHLFFLTILILFLASIEATDHPITLWRIFAILIGAGVVLATTLLNQAVNSKFPWTEAA